MVIYKNPKYKNQFPDLVKKIMPRKHKFLLMVFEEAAKLPRYYLQLDL